MTLGDYMDKKLQDIEKRRIDLYQVYKKETKIGLLVLVIGIVIFVLDLLANTGILFLIGLIVFVVGVVLLARAQVHAKKFKDIVKGELIVTLLQGQFENVRYTHHHSISSHRINEVGMIKRPDRFKGEDYISGTYKGVDFEVSDIEMKERVETRDSKGNRQVTYRTYFKGRWYIYKFGRTFDGVIKISEGRNFNMNTRKLVKIDTESIAFNKKFSIYASSQEYAFYHITPRILEKFMDLEKMHKGSIYYCFVKNELHIGVNDNHDYLELPLRKAVNEQALTEFKSDIDLIPAIINELNLDSRRFLKQE